jgi:hypothetical protein
MNICELRNNLNTNSLKKIEETKKEIETILGYRKKLIEVLENPRLNYWEVALGMLGRDYFCRGLNKDKYIIFVLLYVKLRKDGMKFPILVKKYRDDGYPLDKWELLNGHHRIAMAEILDMKDVPVKFEGVREED